MLLLLCRVATVNTDDDEHPIAVELHRYYGRHTNVCRLTHICMYIYTLQNWQLLTYNRLYALYKIQCQLEGCRLTAPGPCAEIRCTIRLKEASTPAGDFVLVAPHPVMFWTCVDTISFMNVFDQKLTQITFQTMKIQKLLLLLNSEFETRQGHTCTV